MGYLASNKTFAKGEKYKDGYRNPKVVYSFTMGNCKQCSMRKECLGKQQDRVRRYTIRILEGLHKEQEEFEKTEYFNERLKKKDIKLKQKMQKQKSPMV